MKRFVGILLVLVMAVSCLAACGHGDGDTQTTETSAGVPETSEQTVNPDETEGSTTEALSGEALSQAVLDSIEVSLLDRSVVPLNEASLKKTSLEIHDLPEGVTEATVFTLGFAIDKQAHPEYEYRIKNMSGMVELLDADEKEYPSRFFTTRFLGKDDDYCIMRIVAADDVASSALSVRIHDEWDKKIQRVVPLPTDEIGFEDAIPRFAMDNQPDLTSHIVEISNRHYFIEMDGSIDRDAGRDDNGRYAAYTHEYFVFPLEGSMICGFGEEDFTVDVQKDVPDTSVNVTFKKVSDHPEKLSFLFEAKRVMPDKEQYSDEDMNAAFKDMDEAFANTYFKAVDGSFAMRSAGTYGTN